MISKASITAYRACLREYETKFLKYLKGMDTGHKAYSALEADLITMRKYLLMLEIMHPELLEHKPKKYAARY